MATVCVRNVLQVESANRSQVIEWAELFDASTPAAAMVKARAWMRRSMDRVSPERIKVVKALPGLTYISIMPEDS